MSSHEILDELTDHTDQWIFVFVDWEKSLTVLENTLLDVIIYIGLSLP